MKSPLLVVEDLHVTFSTEEGHVYGVRGASFSLEAGETLAIVGESGSGKSAACQALLGLHPAATRITGSIRLQEQEITDLSRSQLEHIRGAEIAMIFQDPMTSLNPTMRIGTQVTEAIRLHRQLSRKEAKSQAIELLQDVGIAAPEKRFYDYPHMFSGGMRQRVMIAIALSCKPSILVADEPTTALDTATQEQILALLKSIQRKTDLAIILVTHDLAIVERFADRVTVMYGGKTVESAPAEALYSKPLHPYTQALVRTIPRPSQPRNVPLATIEGRPPNLASPPAGCPFWQRCPHAMRICDSKHPASFQQDDQRSAACWLYHPLARAER